MNEILSLVTPDGIATEFRVTFPSVMVTVERTALVVTCKLFAPVAENDNDGISQSILAFNVPNATAPFSVLLGKLEVVLIHI